MQNRVLLRGVFLFLLTACWALSIQGQSTTRSYNKVVQNPEVLRDKRGFFFHSKNQKPGFFRTLFSVIYEQWSDTKGTLNKVNTLINDNFLPENAPVTPAPTPPSDPNITTTAAPYKIKRSEFNKIIQRNLKGIVRLFNIELEDALKASEKTQVAYRKNATLEVSKFL